MTYATPAQAEQRALAQLEYYRSLAAGPAASFRLVTTQAELAQVVASWTPPPVGTPPSGGTPPGGTPPAAAAPSPLVGLVLLMEGADPIIHPDRLPDWHQAGLRLIGPAWHATRYSGGTGAPGPLTALGRQLLEGMARLNLLLDLSHLSEAAYLEAVDSYPAGLLASHSNPHAFLPTDRGLSDEMMRKLIARDGVIGVNLYNRFLQPGWNHGQPRRGISLQTVADVIDYIVQLAGSARHVALGSDLDGGFGLDAIPAGMDTCADLLPLAGVLEGRGYTRDDIEAIMNGNWLRTLALGLP